jgi:DNA-binding transcriptional LysR family regulator
MLQADDLDVGVLCAPPHPPENLQDTHRFRDDFVLIAPEATPVPADKLAPSWRKWAAAQSWLLMSESTQTGSQLRKWMDGKKWNARAAMEMDSFDSIIQLVALGMGVSLVPHRALAFHARKRGIRRHATPARFSRELVVLSRGTRQATDHVTAFIHHILF